MDQEQVHVSVLAIDFVHAVQHLLAGPLYAPSAGHDLGRYEDIGALEA